MDFSQPLEDLVRDLNADPDRLRATLDLTRLNPPGVYVALDEISDWRLGGCGEMTVRLWVAAPATATESRSYRQLSALLFGLLDTLDALQLPITSPVRAETLQPAGVGEAYPALTFTTSLSTIY